MSELISQFDLIVIVGDLVGVRKLGIVSKPLIYIGNRPANFFEYLVTGIFLHKTKKIKDNFVFELLLLVLKGKK